MVALMVSIASGVVAVLVGVVTLITFNSPGVWANGDTMRISGTYYL